MHWPGMSAQIDDYVEFVLKTEALTRKRDDTVYNLELPREVVGTELFQWLGSNYVLVVDYMSTFFEASKLENSA